MDSIVAAPVRSKVSKSLNPSRKIRIIGKIRGFTYEESQSLNQESKNWISVKKPEEHGLSSKVIVSFESRSNSHRDSYELDYCYEQTEDNALIYSREIEPMISDVFDGQNASVIAFGARGSGKTCTIQGSQEKPGVAVLAMSEILSKAMELGKSVSVSLYEVIHDHTYDLLDPKHPEVQILESAHGKIHLKGLSQVSVRSIKEFHDIYFSRGTSQKSGQKIPTEQMRSHNGLMIHISSDNDNQKAKITSKMNFVDLAGYEDLRRNTKDGTIFTESSRTNKSLYTLLNVVHALNVDEKRVPYRESKLTRILQESLGGTSHVLMLTCLNPSFCRDSVCSVTLVSLSRRNAKQVLVDSTNRNQIPAKVKASSLVKSAKTPSTSVIMKKQIASSVLLLKKKDSGILRGRKLFDEEKSNKSKQLKSPPEDSSTMKGELLPVVASDVIPFSLEQDVSPQKRSDILDAFPGHLGMEVVPLEKNEEGPPTISERLREISNNLKSLVSSTPSRVKFLDDMITPNSKQIKCTDTLDPKTPVTERAVERYYSPSNRSSGLKHSLVQEYISFLNSATKEELKGLKGIGEKRATYILELHEETPEPFKQLDDLQDIGLSAKQIKGMMKQVAGELFN